MESSPPVLHALSVEPRRARAGDLVRIAFRTRNRGERPTPPARIAFTLDDGLEALGPLVHELAPVAPGEDLEATVTARVRPPGAERAVATAGAALASGDAVYAANACAIDVRGTPVLDGPGSGTSVEAIDDDRVRVRAVVRNEGDAPAFGVRLAVPSPDGTACDAAAGGAVDVPRLDPGESARLDFEARIVAPRAAIVARGGDVRLRDGRRFSLASRAALATAPRVCEPIVAVTAARRRARVSIELRNDGWADANEVDVRIALGPVLALDEHAITVDGLPVAVGARTRRTRSSRDAGGTPIAVARRDGTELMIRLACVPARTAVRIELAAIAPPGAHAGTIGVACAEHRTDAPFFLEPVRAVHLTPIAIPETLSGFDEAVIRLRAWNAGDAQEHLTFAVDAGDGVTIALEGEPRCALDAGAVRELELRVRAGGDPPHGAPFTAAVVATGERGEVARLARAMRVDDGERVHARADGAAQADDGEAPRASRVGSRLVVPGSVVAGTILAVRLELEIDDAVEELTVRAAPVAGAAYVGGSTRVDGHAVIDSEGTASGGGPLESDGLTLRGIPAATPIAISWALLPALVLPGAPAGDEPSVELRVRLDIDGRPEPVEPATVRVAPAAPFAIRPPGLRYHVQARTAAAEETAPPSDPRASDDDRPPVAALVPPLREAAPVEPEPFEPARTEPAALRLHLDDERRAEMARLIDALRGAGLAAHLFAVRLCAANAVDDDPVVARAVEDARAAMCDVFDRLYVKLRIPGFAITCDDLDEPALRRACVTLHELCGDAGAFADAPPGAPAALRALLALLPSRCDASSALVLALDGHARALDRALARYDGLPLEVFDEALAHAVDPSLDGTRTALLDALAPQLALAEAPC